MATDNGRIKAAINSVKAIDYDGPVKGEALAVLEKLSCSEGEWRRRNAQKINYVVHHLSGQWAAGKGANRVRTLLSVADYLDAPDGTVVAKKFGDGYWSKIAGGWEDNQGVHVAARVLAGAERRVTEWGDL